MSVSTTLDIYTHVVMASFEISRHPIVKDGREQIEVSGPNRCGGPSCSTNVLSSLLPAEEYSRGRSAPAARRTEMSVVMEALADPQLLMWGIAYLILKWTLGLWVLRRVRAWAKAKRVSSHVGHAILHQRVGDADTYTRERPIGASRDRPRADEPTAVTAVIPAQTPVSC